MRWTTKQVENKQQCFNFQLQIIFSRKGEIVEKEGDERRCTQSWYQYSHAILKRIQRPLDAFSLSLNPYPKQKHSEKQKAPT